MESKINLIFLLFLLRKFRDSYFKFLIEHNKHLIRINDLKIRFLVEFREWY